MSIPIIEMLRPRDLQLYSILTVLVISHLFQHVRILGLQNSCFSLLYLAGAKASSITSQIALTVKAAHTEPFGLQPFKNSFFLRRYHSFEVRRKKVPRELDKAISSSL